ncbi:DNA translocase FtsK [Psychrobacillus sp. FSL H8-0484]|uniref:DNA translocase FtsK n=1 Tax=Psychrobacillus sp. FSL H8-0484 TaxID=2921390 RepID=UPI0030F6B4E2
MNWFKKLFAVNEDEYRDETEVEVQAVPKTTQPKTPFRFPLISDEEKHEFLYGLPKEEKVVEEPFLEKKSNDTQSFKPLHTQGIWQQRKQQTVVHRAEKKEIEEAPAIIRKKRAFTPTDVPSPIYGFSKEKEKIVEPKQEKEIIVEDPIVMEAPIPVPQQVVEESAAQVMEIMERVESEVEQSVLPMEEIHEAIDTSPIEEVEETKPTVPKENIRPFNVLMLKSDKQKQVEEAAATVMEIIDEVKVEQTSPLIEEIQEFKVNIPIEEYKDTPPIEEVQEEKPTAPKENIRPFNVMMLKSDKQKMNKLDNNPMSQTEQPSAPKPETQIVTSKEALIEEVKQEIVPSSYTRPSFSYLLPPEIKDEDNEWMEEQAFTLVEALSHFQITGEIVQTFQGPAVTQFELTVGHGTKVSKIRNLADDLKLALAAKDIRIQAPIPGKSSIGIEIPNRKSRAVRISEVLNTDVFTNSDSPLEVALGLDLTGKPVTLDLRKMPHGLIAGATGSGKSVFINSLLVSLLYKATPEDVKLLLIDPKMVELAPFNHIPHLVSPVITDVKAATAALKWAVEEMERRYQLFAHVGVRDISRYNTLATEKRQFAQKLPYLVIVIDELADLMMMAPAEVEEAICRIAQKARACGIHLVLATQRPSVDVITGLIKANIPTRIAFSVSSQIDSRTILDQQGAERLLGKGDMLYQGNGMSSPVRIQGTYVSDDEIESVIDYARSQGTPDYMFEQEELMQKAEIASEQDELFEEACRFIVEQGSASTSLLQRKFHLGYNRAARLIDAMYENGYITEQKGSKAREVLLTNDNLEQIFS